MPAPELPPSPSLEAGLSAIAPHHGRSDAHDLLAIQQSVSQWMAEQLTPVELFDRVLELVGCRLGWDLAGAWWREPDNANFGCHAVWSRSGSWADRLEDTMRADSLRPGAGFSGAILANAEPCVVPDLRRVCVGRRCQGRTRCSASGASR